MKPYKAYIQGTVIKDRVQVRVQDHLGPATPATGLELYMHTASGTKGATTSIQLYNIMIYIIYIHILCVKQKTFSFHVELSAAQLNPSGGGVGEDRRQRVK